MWRHLFIYLLLLCDAIYLFIIIIWRHLFIYYYYLTPFFYSIQLSQVASL